MNIQGWRIMEEGQTLSGELGIREAVLETHWVRQNCVHRGVKEKVDPERTSRAVWSFTDFAEPCGGTRSS